MTKSFWQKCTIMTAAIVVMGLALSFLIKVNYGIDPGSFMVRSIALFFGLNFGVMSLIVYGVMLILMLIFDRQLLGVGTFVNMILVGNTADFFGYLQKFFLSDSIFSDQKFFPLKIAIFIMAIAIFIIGAAVYMKCNIGIAPYDAMPLIVKDNLLKNVPFAPLRMTYDFLVVVIGILFCIKKNPVLLKSLPVAIIMVFSVGPVITIVSNWMEKHFKLFNRSFV